MKQKKSIVDLIRENQDKLNERPSPRTWKKLESKLDNRRSKSQTFLYRQLAMAAAVVALVAVISLLAVLSNQKNAKYAAVESSSENWVAQDLESIYTDGNKNVRQVAEFQRNLKERYANPIEEGKPAKKLLASNTIYMGAINQSPNRAKSKIAVNKKPSLKEHKKLQEVEILENEAPELLAEASPEVLQKDQAASSAKVESGDFSKMNNAAKSTTSATSPQVLNRRAKKKAAKPSLENLNWLQGKWMENNKMAEWKKIGNEVFVTEKFLIKKDVNTLLFIVNDGVQEAFTLSSQNPVMSVFENKDEDKVLIHQIDKSNFSILFDRKGIEEQEILFYKRK